MNTESTLLIPLPEVARRLSIGRTSLYQLRQAGAFGPRVHNLAGKLLVRSDELADWVGQGMPSFREFQGRRATIVKVG